MEANSKSRARLRLRQVTIVLGTIATAAIVAACSSEETSADQGEEGFGLSQIDPVANAPEAANPVDATPSPDGKDVYFIAFSTQPGPDGIGTVRVPAIFKVSAAGGTPPQKLHEGAPLNSPFNITTSDDGQTLFIADSSADENATEDGAERSDGRVFAMSAGGGTPTVLAGTEGITPAGVEVLGDSLYVTGRKDGQPGLYKTGIGGGAVSAVGVGAPFVDPGGVAIAKNGVAYVVDTGNALTGQAMASVIMIQPDGRMEIIADGLSVGHPAGIALVGDDSAVIVSGLDNASATDRVFRIEVGSRSMKTLDSKIGEFYESAGLHRARGAQVFAWADSHANGTGTVYVLRP